MSTPPPSTHVAVLSPLGPGTAKFALGDSIFTAGTGTTLHTRLAGVQNSTVIPATIKMPDADFKKAIIAMGLGAEVLQEAMADLAYTNHADYIATKRSILDAIRGHTAATYTDVYNKYIGSGHDKKTAKEVARNAAKVYKDTQMGLFYTAFPKQLEGQQVHKTY